MKPLRSATLLAIFLSGLLAAADVTGEYIVELSGEPAISAAPVKSPRLAASRSSVRAAQTSVRARFAAANIDVMGSVDTVMNALIVRSDDPSLLARTPGVARVYPVRLYKMLLDRAAVLHNVSAAALNGGWENAGSGMKIGVIDSGVDVSHPAFKDAGYSLPDGFPKVNKDTDNQFTNNKVIVARNYDTRVSATANDRKGHGTAVAMAAAGNRNTGPRATIMGIAPKAWIGSYKVFPDNQEGAPNSYILKAIDDAVADGMDVINLSLGGFPAEHLDSDPLVRAVENASRAGVIVVVAVGNEGPGLNTVGSPATAPSAISVGSSFNDRVFASSAWFEGFEPFLAVPSDAPRNDNMLRAQITDITSRDQSGLACTELPADSLTGKVVLILRGTCLFEEKINNAQRAGAVGVIIYTHADRPSAEQMTTGSARLPAVMISHPDGIRARERLQSGDVEVIIDFSEHAVPVTHLQVPDFSSKGPSVDHRLKPEILAVGTSVYTAQPAVMNEPAYSSLQGTSLSAPIVAGAAALLKAARPGLTGDQYKSLLMNSAAAFLINDRLGPVQQTGAGLLDVGSAVRSTIAASPSALDFGIGGSTIDSTRTFVVRNLGTAGDTFSITASPIGESATPVVSPGIVELAPGGTAEVTVHFTGQGLSNRSHEGFLTLRGTQTDVATRLPYWYAATDGVATSINVVEAPSQGRRASTQDFYVRSLDGSGVSLQSEPEVTIVSTGLETQVVTVESVDYRYPGFFRVRVRLSSEAGPNVFQIKAGSATTQVTITGT